MSVVSILAASLLFGQAPMNGEAIPGTALDARISACGLRVEGTQDATIAPFIETRHALSGRVSIDLVRRSAGGTANITQEQAFSGGSLDLSITVDRPSQVTISMRIVDGQGKALCRLEANVDFAEAPRNI